MLKKVIKKILGVNGGFKKNYHFDTYGKFYKPEDMTLLGSEYGGWYIPSDFDLSENDVCYFAGAGEDISFDCSIASFFPCQVHIFDPTPKSIQHFNSLKNQVKKGKKIAAYKNRVESKIICETTFNKIHFYPWGLAGQDGENKFYFPANPKHVSCSIVNLQKTNDYFIADCFTIPTIMKRLGHNEIKFLKMDIEGAEYQVIDNMISKKILPSLLAIEFDELHTELDNQAKKRIDDYVMSIISSGYEYIFRDNCNLVFRKK